MLRDGKVLCRRHVYLLRDMHEISDDAIGRAEVDRLLADAKVRLLRKLGEKVDNRGVDSEEEAAGAEETAADARLRSSARRATTDCGASRIGSARG